jgi:hypothetical protein
MILKKNYQHVENQYDMNITLPIEFVLNILYTLEQPCGKGGSWKRKWGEKEGIPTVSKQIREAN